MKRRWRMLSFRVGVLGTAALAALVAAATLLTGREPLAAALLLCAAAGLGAVAWLCVVRPYRAQERAMLMFLEGYTPPRQDAACALSPAQARLQEQVAAILNPEQLFNLNKRQAQYQALQNQINPHFLYNTLESIRGEALLSGMDTIADMTEALATFFRYTISKVENLVSVEEELQNCETYFHIQRYRFADRLELHISCDPADREAIYRCRLPKLTIQPIVENSIIHGFADSGGRIEVRARMSGEELEVTVQDDGCGMSEESLRRFREPGTDEKRHHLGLRNVDAILRLHYGEDHGLRFPPADGRGTCVEISLPARFEEG